MGLVAPYLTRRAIRSRRTSSGNPTVTLRPNVSCMFTLFSLRDRRKINGLAYASQIIQFNRYHILRLFYRVFCASGTTSVTLSNVRGILLPVGAVVAVVLRHDGYAHAKSVGGLPDRNALFQHVGCP
jgi:hypothetical protein